MMDRKTREVPFYSPPEIEGRAGSVLGSPNLSIRRRKQPLRVGPKVNLVDEAVRKKDKHSSIRSRLMPAFFQGRDVMYFRRETLRIAQGLVPFTIPAKGQGFD